MDITAEEIANELRQNGIVGYEVALARKDQRIAELEAALKIVDEDVRHHLRGAYAEPGTSIPAALIRPHAIKAVRDALRLSNNI